MRSLSVEQASFFLKSKTMIAPNRIFLVWTTVLVLSKCLAQIVGCVIWDQGPASLLSLGYGWDSQSDFTHLEFLQELPHVTGLNSTYGQMLCLGIATQGNISSLVHTLIGNGWLSTKIDCILRRLEHLYHNRVNPTVRDKMCMGIKLNGDISATTWRIRMLFRYVLSIKSMNWYNMARNRQSHCICRLLRG